MGPCMCIDEGRVLERCPFLGLARSQRDCLGMTQVQCGDDIGKSYSSVSWTKKELMEDGSRRVGFKEIS